MSGELASGLLFYLLGALVVVGAGIVAFARNIVHSAFALLGTFAGMAGLYAMLSADLVAVIQLMVYVGGVLILILFSVMLTARIDEANVSNPAIGRFGGLLAFVLIACVMVYAGIAVLGRDAVQAPVEPTVPGIGDALLTRYVLPFEVISVLLLAALLGAVTIASGRLRKPGPGGSEGEGKA